MELELIKQQAAEILQVAIEKIQLKRKQGCMLDWSTFALPEDRIFFLIGMTVTQYSYNGFVAYDLNDNPICYSAFPVFFNTISGAHIEQSTPVSASFKPEIFVKWMSNDSDRTVVFSYYEIIVKP